MLYLNEPLVQTRAKAAVMDCFITLYFKNKYYIIIISIVNALYFCQQVSDKISESFQLAKWHRTHKGYGSVQKFSLVLNNLNQMGYFERKAYLQQ